MSIITEHTNQSVRYTRGVNSIEVNPTTGLLISNGSTISTINSSSITSSYTYSNLRQPADTNIAIFNGYVLSIDGSNNSYQNSQITVTGTNNNVVSSLNLTNMIIEAPIM